MRLRSNAIKAGLASLVATLAVSEAGAQMWARP